MSLRRVVLLLLSLLVLIACDDKVEYDHQAYIWQRVWRPSHQSALSQSKLSISQFRVLATQFHPRTGWRDAAVDLPLLAQDRRPVILVIRIDGGTVLAHSQLLLAKTRTLISLWRDGGTNLVGIEIDFDCASSQLNNYAQLLHGLRTEMAADLRLSITALPTWLQSSDLDQLFGAADETVLQLHSLTNPQAGLFDPLQAERWAAAWSQRTSKAFYLALPSYGSEVIAVVDGDAVVESEAPRQSATMGQEVTSDPYVLNAFIQQLKRRELKNLNGFIWFRLPLGDDHRVWPWPTLAAVIHQQDLSANTKLNLVFKPESHYADLILVNNGNAPARSWPSVTLSVSDCIGGDGMSGYTLSLSPNKAILLPPATRSPLQAGKQQAIAWLNCKTIMQDK